jgi:hypothetical protein
MDVFPRCRPQAALLSGTLGLSSRVVWHGDVLGRLSVTNHGLSAIQLWAIRLLSPLSAMMLNVGWGALMETPTFQFTRRLPLDVR